MKRQKRNQVIQPLKPADNTRFRWYWMPIATFLTLVLIAILFLIILGHDLPSLSRLEDASDPSLASKLISSDGVVLKELFIQNRNYVTLDQIPVHLRQAIIAAEDRRFYAHWGLDMKRIAGAIIADLRQGGLKQGASTLTQQLARYVYLHRKKSWVRKLKEQLTALQIERTYSKNEILEMYLNYFDLGRGAHGVQAAALAYFDKNVQELSIQESAMIAGMFQLPYGPYNPDRDTTRTIDRRNLILTNMMDAGYLTETESDSIRRLPLNVVPKDADTEDAIAPYFCEHIRQQLYNEYGMALYTEGLNIYTSLDTRVQACAERAIDSFMPKMDEKVQARIRRKPVFFDDWIPAHLAKTPQDIKKFKADSVKMDSVILSRSKVQIALTAIEPATGHILAMVGGRDFNTWKLNRATQSARQPGSAFKPIVLTAAIDNGYRTTTKFMNTPIVLHMVDGSRWTPSNYEESATGGPTSLRVGLAKSLNLVAAHMVVVLGLQQRAAEYAGRFGFTTRINPYDAISLGADVVYPIELTAAYATFANHGVRNEPTAVLRIIDKNGNVIKETFPRGEEVISEATAYIMSDMMQSVMTAGTGRNAGPLYQFYRPSAGKTGTTNEYRNAWFAGFTPQITASVWVGMDDERISLGEHQTGAVCALPVWAPFMRMAHDTLNLPIARFHMPSGVTPLTVCHDSGLLATGHCPHKLKEVFLNESKPTEPCDQHGPGAVPRSNRTIF